MATVRIPPVLRPAVGGEKELTAAGASVGEILDSLKTITGFPIEMDDAARKKMDPSTKISFKVKDLTLTSALKLLFTPQGFEVKVVDKKKIVITVPKEN